MVGTDFETVRWSFDRDSGIGRLVIDRPEKHNAISEQVAEELGAGLDAFEAVDEDADQAIVRAVIIEGAGEASFSSGADISEFPDVDPAQSELPRIWDDAIQQFAPPVIAKIDGICFAGGFEIALASDFRIASRRSTFAMKESNIGIYPGAGGTQRLSLLVGPSRAKELCMTAEEISGEQALEEGIVDYVYPADRLEAEVRQFAEQIADRPPLAVRAIKDVVDNSLETGLAEGRKYEFRRNRLLFASKDADIGIEAFLEGREPEWRGE
ncbi:enoyl-CoA hydratase/isomerase family protein [Natrinema halophilum]|uniref:enoyl-CoA hydratase/isomerase family protein n=1 Tax=Natrinema halophilum TaxID=1699371 RepID=UPI001F381419|nr:enoyl-CoA hydratase/isomerase family protein [Natrinema halophilum]UHQ96325.1 enoyl-CoA hydratase/isomerase family protein [Natrinema halophilum]